MPRPAPEVFERLLRRVDVPAWQADPPSRPTSGVHEAFTGEHLADVPLATAEDVTDAFARARAAQVAWAARPVRERAAVLTRFADLVHVHRDALLDLVQAETGKNRASALEEVIDCFLNARFYAARGPRWLAPRRVTPMLPVVTRARVEAMPRGVVGVITPWNYPLSLAMTDALAALLAGNAIVMKPATLTPFSALAGVELFDRAGLPRDLWQVVPGSGREVGGAIVESCDYLMFTGSSATGAELAGRMASRLVPFSAELGGKNPLIIGPGVDLARVADIAVRACFASAGQLCMSIERIYVDAGSYDDFCRLFAERVRAMRVAPGYDWGPEMGCLVSADQLAVVEEHIADAVARGARVLAGGRRRPDLGPTFHEPTVLVDVPANALAFSEETFGPVVSVSPVASLEEAVERANDSVYGLLASVFCATDAEGAAVASRLRTGMVVVNEGYAPAWASLGGPSGGMGRSGVGYRHGREGLLTYTHQRTIATQARWLSLDAPPFVERDRWPEVLERASNLLRYLPGR